MFTSEDEYYNPPDCKWCDGRGWNFVRNGPDDVDKDPCECWVERKTMGKELAKYPSKSSPGKEYTIFEAADGTEYCDCWIWKRKKTCKHLEDYQKSGAPSVVATKPATMKSGTVQGKETVVKQSEAEHVIDNIINQFA